MQALSYLFRREEVRFRFISREDVVFGLLTWDSSKTPQNWPIELKFLGQGDFSISDPESPKNWNLVDPGPI